MIELYQTEWCPHSAKVRQRLTELGVPFVARQVEADRDDREAMRRATGEESIPVLVLSDGTRLTGDSEELLAELDRLFPEPAEAGAHRDKAEEHG